MKSILEEFAYGNISMDVHTLKNDSRYVQAVNAASSCEKKLLIKLEEEDKIIFQKFIDAQNEVNQLIATQKFINGYKMGLLMTAEAFVKGGDLFDDEV